LIFFGLNNYSATYVKAGGDWPLEYSLVQTGRPQTQCGWECNPEGFYEIIKWVNDTYHPKKIIVTENGCASNDWVDDDNTVDDSIRFDILETLSTSRPPCHYRGYSAEGLFCLVTLDNFEWAEGLTIRFGWCTLITRL